MKRLHYLLILIACLLNGPVVYAQPVEMAPSVTPPFVETVSDGPAPLTMEDCYRLALKRSEQIGISAEAIKQTEGRFLQALGTALPRISFTSTDLWQDGTGASAFTLRHRPERAFSFSQPLFTGFKEFAAITGAKHEYRQRKEEKLHAELSLLTDVADAFHLLLEQREDIAAVEGIRVALVDRLDELQGREHLGRSRASEAKTVETQLRQTEAQLEQAKSGEQITRQLLEFLIGQPVTAITDPSDGVPAPLEEPLYETKADDRPDVQAAEAAWKVAEKAVIVAQSQLWPTVNADGNYYTERAGVAQDVKWDVTLTVDVPLFQGGQAVGAVKEALSESRAAKLHYVERQRTAELDIKDAYAKLGHAITVARLLDEAVASAEESYRLQVEDYRLSVVNNLDVLQALQTLQTTRRDDIHARREAKRAYWQLRAATGEGFDAR